MPNRLAGEKSPYLLQHAHNPVDWQPWGEEAFDQARRENKPIFLSIGYSACHWCHVMERESFENAEVAAVLNKRFVSIKVDREERPDVDKVYMTAVQALTGQGGWPLSAFLTPELKPFYGGTYFPPEGRFGLPGFKELILRIAQLWGERSEDIKRDAEKVFDLVRQRGGSETRKDRGQGTGDRGQKTEASDAVEGEETEEKSLSEKLISPLPPDPGPLSVGPSPLLSRGFEALRASFDPENGGFGGAPKFPMPVYQEFLLRYWARSGQKEALDMAVQALTAMARGGICDQLGGGFHRYSTDEKWRVPHFEKMLYDNAQLAVNSLEAYQATRGPGLKDAAVGVLDYLALEMRHPDGGFYSAQDADSPELVAREAASGASLKEGAFYLWRETDIRRILGPDADLFISRYGIRPEGNTLSDPHGEFGNANVLYQAGTIEDAAEKFKLSIDEAKGRLAGCRQKLLAERGKRPRPFLDDKILAAWNGLAISAFAKAYQVLGRRSDLSAAEKAAAFIRERLYDAESRRLKRRWRDGDAAVDGMADDYAFLIQGLIDLYEASFEAGWLLWAVTLAEEQNRLFSAPDGGFYMTARRSLATGSSPLPPDSPPLPLMIEESDNVEPSASSISALNFLRLHALTNRQEFLEAASKTLDRFKGLMAGRPMAVCAMLGALDLAVSGGRQVVIAGEREDPGTAALIKELRSHFLPDAAVLLLDKKSEELLTAWLPFLKPVDVSKKPAAYVCRGRSCGLPASTPAELRELL